MIGEIFNGIKAVSNLIDDLHTSTEEKAEAQLKLSRLSADMTRSMLEHEAKVLEEQAKNIRAEANSESWLARNWRPIVMLSLTALVGLDSFGVLSNPLSDDAWLLLQIGIGGYVVGRSGEKIAKTVRATKDIV